MSLAACQPPSQPADSPSPASPIPSTPHVEATPGEQAVATVSPTPDEALVGDLQADLQTDKPVYQAGETVQVTVIAMGLTDSAWVWVVPEDVEVKPTARPSDSAFPNPTVDAKSPLEVKLDKPGKYQAYLFPSADLSAPIASRGFEVK